jgi:antirestriction protein
MTHEQQPGAAGETPEPKPGLPESSDRPEKPDFERPEIWIGSLADYNNGDLHGGWLDAAREPAEIHADIQDILASGPAARRGEAPEEWAIFDHEGFGPLEIGEYESIEDVSRLARAIAEHGPAFAAWASGIDRDEATAERFQEAYQGRFDSVVDYARQLADDLGYEQLLDEALPDHVRSYVQVNYEQLAHDLQVGGDISTEFSDDGGVHIFRNE